MGNEAEAYAENEVEIIKQRLTVLNYDDHAFLHFVIKEAYQSGYNAAVLKLRENRERA